MARKTNKTDHVLNLLSSGKKSGKEENDAPPVDLRRKAPEPVSDDPFETHLPEPKMTAQEEEEELPEPRMSPREEASELPEPRMTFREEPEDMPEPRASESLPTEGKPAVVTVAAAAPSVSVVHASDGENSIAEAVKDSLEAEFNEYLREKEELEEKLDEKLGEIVAQQEQAIEWKTSEPKEPAGINVFELLGGDEEPDEEPATMPEPIEASEPIEELEPVKETIQQVEAVEEPETAMESEAEAEPEPAEETQQVEETEAIDEAPDEEAESVEAVEEAEEEQPVEEAQEAAQAVEESMPQQEAIQEKEESMPQSENEEKNYVTINVMERLVRDQVPTYVKQFGHCDCDRCIEDTVALTLTHLPSKYVVVNKDAVSPLLNFYEKKYAGQLIVEITKATMIVNGSPHH